MKGFAYLDVDGGLYTKSYDYITTENPYFWKDNDHLIACKWSFDTDIPSTMRMMLIQFRNLQLKKHLVDSFLEAIGYDPTVLKNASKV